MSANKCERCSHMLLTPVKRDQLLPLRNQCTEGRTIASILYFSLYHTHLQKTIPICLQAAPEGDLFVALFFSAA